MDKSLPDEAVSPSMVNPAVKKKVNINVNASEGENADSFPSEARTPVKEDKKPGPQKNIMKKNISMDISGVDLEKSLVDDAKSPDMGNIVAPKRTPSKNQDAEVG